MLDADGHFHYQVWPWTTVRIPYMRWSQAWMLLAMATLLSGLATVDAGSAASQDNANAH